ncbi:FAD synthetase 2, chloroplastic [Diospyros lotus]|uniref:FAD synthetase 2, chloroplastic n=1 Tax=Diospyros lotus TaxID=55363 RepID=UPI002254F1EE|nr:FAD synthetase 2, chloroplastic [Diospyros lotus]
MMLSGSRISYHIRECNHHHHQIHLGLGLGFGLGFRTTLHLSSNFIPRPPSSSSTVAVSDNRSNSSSSSSRIDLGPRPQSTSGQASVLSDCFSQHEDDRTTLPEGLASVAGGMVALGKFDALHIGHRELAIQAAKFGVPFLLSFVGMAEVLGWEPRAPIVAKCDRKRVLSSWAPYCGNMIPTEHEVQFSKVRHLSPHQFVEKLSKEFGVRGVVAGENYRFGYKAAGDASELVRLCKECGMEAYIIKSVMDQNQDSKNIGSTDSKELGQVSSTRVRYALANGNVKYVSELLGRQHRLVLMVKDEKWSISSQNRVSARRSCLLNLAPKDGLYNNCHLITADDENVGRCRVKLDATGIHLELDDDIMGVCNRIVSQDFHCLGIDFGW